MTRTTMRLAVLSAAFIGVAGMAASQESPSEFYEGNVIRWIVPYLPGGGYDEYSRLLAPYMSDYTGARIDIVNVNGSGGMRGAVELFNAPNDGTTIGLLNGPALVTNQLAGIEGADYTISDYSFLGRLVAGVRVLVTGSDSGLPTFEDILDTDGRVVLGANGLGGSSYVDAVLVGEALDVDQKLVHGFNTSSDIRTAILRGDVQGMWGSLGSAASGIDSGDLTVVLHGVRDPAPDSPLADAPSAWDKLSTANDPDRAERILDGWGALSDVGRPVAGPPGIPAARLAFLRDAFEQAVSDPGFVTSVEQAQRYLSYASGEEMERIASSATEFDAAIEGLFVRAIRGDI